ncbi:MAG: AI-2E family transporter [Oscillospiraceae bacterium]|nr:AI-2E family transporter [Oscillospiraceae bacterium]
MKKSNIERAKWIPIFIIAIVLMLIYKTIDNIGQITSAIWEFLLVISPLMYGILFTYFLYRPHQALEKLVKKIRWKFISKRARGFSTIIIFLLVICLIILIMSFLLPIIVSNIISLGTAIPGYVNIAIDYIDNLPETAFWADIDIAGTINEFSGTLFQNVMSQGAIEQVFQEVMNFAGGIFSAILGLVISLYILLDRERIAGFFKRLNNAVFKQSGKAGKAEKYVTLVNKVLFAFIAGKGLDSMINLVVVTSILLIFGIPYAFLFGLIAAMFNFIPYIGSLISVVSISIVALITTDLSVAIPTIICLIIFQQLDGNYIEPRIMRSSLKINPIIVIIAVIIGGAYMGVVGMFLAVPIAAVIKQIIIEYINSRETNTKEVVAETETTDVEVTTDYDRTV